MRQFLAVTGLFASLLTPAHHPQWTACQGGQECTTVSAPVDYAHPDGPHIDLAVSRIAAAQPGKRRGVLVLIPGGPGSSGLNRPSAFVDKLPPAVRDRYDLVSFDPRGVGASAPISCGLSTDDLASSHVKPWPGPGGDIGGSVERARRVADACLRNAGPLGRQVKTRNEVRDLDRIREALGERKLSYWGVSYGTYVGAVYATEYPQHTDRVVLDSNDDPNPDRVERGWAANYAIGTEDRFPDFAAYYGPGARQTFLALTERLDQHPMPWPGANPPVLDGNVLRDSCSTRCTATPRSRNWPR
jgi:pimeloyl-ACP methyl ester carboxylesterase